MSKEYFKKFIKFNVEDGLEFIGMSVDKNTAPYGSLIAVNGGGLTKNPKKNADGIYEIDYWFDGLERGDGKATEFFYYNATRDIRAMSRGTPTDKPPFDDIVWFYQVQLNVKQNDMYNNWLTMFTFPIGMQKYQDQQTMKWHNRFWSGNLVTKFGDDNKVWLFCQSAEFPRETYYMKISLSQSEDENTCYINIEKPVKS